MISNRKALPTGVSSFEQLRGENYYIVDKTLIIEEFLRRKSIVTLITRPRRFGKTMNLTYYEEKSPPSAAISKGELNPTL